MQFKQLLREFVILQHHVQWIIGITLICSIAALTILLVFIELYPTGVGSLLAFVTAVFALLFAKEKHPSSPGKEQTITLIQQ